ncbi:cleavage and polyadenylation specificity factor subunit CG7185 [Olea europaea subsp. europaea]|uniref:Cleavage and polyadenylation specificity factor subunit CG7185 n=1 Tax=Olea europaea subsp. europaea TaxID=158383 RepID=A0A8S0URI8_OLEEU|nr:cleavage and polyadenylation specificity factor subunit CG7185 [Olea europaea subsp. europaea]
MDENEAGEQFHRNEAISAVADEGFLAEEEDDYEDLYNDVNVGENFLQSIRKNEDNLGQRNEQVPENKAEPTPPPRQAPQPVVESRGGAVQDEGESTRDSVRVEAHQNLGFRGNNSINDIGAGRGLGVTGGSGLGIPGAVGFRVELKQSSNKPAEFEEQTVNNSAANSQQMVQHQQPRAANIGVAASPVNVGIGGNVTGTGGYIPGSGVGSGTTAGGGGGGGGTILFVGDLHWWTTDSELEEELSKYGPVKEVKFFDEKASGKSKGYCQVEFFNPDSATACKEGMNGHLFNGRPCVVAYASPYSVKRMGEAQLNRNQNAAQPAVNQPRRGPGGTGDVPGKPSGGGGGGGNMAIGGNYQGSGDGHRGFGRGNWGRGNGQGGMGNRGPMGPMRNRGGGIGGRGLMGNGNGFAQGIGATPPLLHPQTMMGQGFDPAFGGPMGRMGSYGGFPGAPAPPFSGMLSSFGPVGSVGLPGVAPHVNPAFFGRGMPMNGMGMMPAPGFEGPHMGTWSDPNMAGWTGDEHGGRAGESSYGEEAASDHQYGEGSHDKGPWANDTKEKDRGSERDWSGSSDRRYRDDREPGYDRDMPREKDTGHDREWSERRHRDGSVGVRDRERDRDRDRNPGHSRDRERERGRDRDRQRDDRDVYADHHRYRDREPEYDDEWDRVRSSRTHSKSRLSHEEDRRSRSRDADYGKRRRLTSE